MSFILDALRKSELERQRQSGPSIAELPVARHDRRPPWAMLAIGLLLAVNAGVLLYFLLRDTGSATAVAASSPPAAVAAAPVATAPAPASAPVNVPPAADALPDGAEIFEAEPLPDASSPPPAPDPTLVPEASVTYGPGPVEDLPKPIDELPAQATAGLPELSVDLHIYTDDPAKRAVFINGRRYQRGGVLVEGPRVEEINREGAVLSYRGQRFLLPRQ
jgi:general secretion pathway protein B